MSEPQPEPADDAPAFEATLLSRGADQPPAVDGSTHSSFSPQDRTSAGETKGAGLSGTVVTTGSQLGPYLLLNKLGEGGMGAVYKARHTKLDRLVALKVLSSHVLSRPDALSRFEREMKAVGKLQHANVVQALDAGDFGGVHYLSMEYVEGQDLQEVVKAGGPMSVVNACKAVRQAALGLAAAHKLGLVHRDIKPSNLFVTKETGQIKILDMGLALLSHEEADAALTSTGQCFGTPDYMAPEQWEDAHTCDARADLYALGCTLFLLLVGRTPYGGDEYRSVPKKMKGHVYDPIPDLKAARAAVGWALLPDHSSPSAALPMNDANRTGKSAHPTIESLSDMPDGLDAIYRKLMAKEPKDRFASADQLAEALAPFTRQGRPQPSHLHAPSEESRTPSDSPKRSGSDAVPAPSDVGPAPEIVTQSETAILGETPDDPLNATSTWTFGDAAALLPSAVVPPRGPRSKWLLALGGAAAMVLLGVIIITITNKDGTKTKIEVPGDSKVEISTRSPTNSVSRAASAPGLSEHDKVQGLTPPGSPKQDIGWHGWPADAPKPAVAPFDAAQAKKYQEEWAAYLKLPVEYTNSLGMKFILIPPGEFTMGSTPEEIEEALKEHSDADSQEKIQSEAPQHKVTLSQPIYLGIHEVTQEWYEKIVGTNPSHFSSTGAGMKSVENIDTRNHPVENLSWNDAAEFCAKLSRQEQMKPFYFRGGDVVTPMGGASYRLPTEAEWEFACRAGTTTKFWIGDDEKALLQIGWFGVNSGNRTHAVAELIGNPFGIYDIHGNVFEWVQDWHESTYYGQFRNQTAIDPSGPALEGSNRVLRGWSPNAGFCRSAIRYWFPPTIRFSWLGLRVALPVEAVRKSLAARGPLQPVTYFESNRRAAQRVLDVGGEAAELFLQTVAKREHISVRSGQPLPEEPFLVRNWSVKNSTKVTNADLEVLSELKHVQVLNLSANGRLDGQVIPILAAMQSPLAELSIGHTNVKTSDLGRLPVMSHVHLIWLTSEQVDDGWKFLRQFPALRTVELYGVSFPTLEPLGDYPHLRHLRLVDGPKPDAAVIDDLQRRNPRLRILHGSGADRQFLGNDPARAAARRLIEAGIPVSVPNSKGEGKPVALSDVDQTLARFWYCEGIPRGVMLTDELRELLTHFTLHHFAAEGQANADALAQVLSQRHECVTINLLESDLTDAGLSALRPLTGLIGLDVTGTKVTPAGVAAFHRAVPGCRVAADFGVTPPDDELVPEHWPKTRTAAARPPAIDFAAERQAAEWVLENNGSMEIAVSPDWQWQPYRASGDAKPLPTESFAIANLDLRQSQVKSDEDLARITRCQYIEVLNLAGASGGDKSIELLTRLPRLKQLGLGHHKSLRTSALPSLGRIPPLSHLSITPEMVDDRLEFVRHLPALRTLTIWGPQPPDIALLADAPQLRTILLTTPDTVDDAKLAAVQSRHDPLRIVVGWMGKYRTVGRDPVHEAAKQLVELGVECYGGVNYWQPPTKLLTKSDFEDGSIWSFDVRKIPATVQLSADDREKLTLLDLYHFTAEGQRDADELAKSLSGNHGIASINITDCDLTDAGLEHLQKLMGLRWITLSKTQVTKQGIERLRQALPWTGINSDFGNFKPKYSSGTEATPAK